MPYISQLTDRAAVYRPTIAEGSTGQRKATPVIVAGMDAVPCKLMDAGHSRLQEVFGATVKADCMVYFPADTDVRPGLTATDGKNDRLVITNERGVVSRWLVASVKDPGSRRKMIVAAVVRSDF
ncbi:MAG: hypothetical protein AB7I37_19590 [Pirellulales bacterium]